MPSLTPTDVHRNQFLSNFLLAYRPMGFIAPDVFPQVEVNKQTGEYAVLNKSDWLRRTNTQRSPGQKPNYVNFSVSSDTYFARNYALGNEVWYETLDNADPPLDPKQDGAAFIKDQLMLDFECRVFDKVSTGVGSSLTAGAAWSDYAASDPISESRTARQAVRGPTGLRPNLAIVPQKVADHLMFHPDFIAAAKGPGGMSGMVDAVAMAQVLQVQKVLIPDTVRNTGTKGLADSFTDVWSTNVYLLHVKENPGLRAATFGLAFNWVGPNIGRNTPTNFQVYEKADDEAGTVKIWSGYHQDEKVIAPELGFEIKTGIS